VITDKALEQRLLETFGFLRDCDERIYREFLSLAFVVKLEKGQPVSSEGAECSHLALVLSGNARVYKLGESGREITLYRVGPGQSCVLTASCIQSHQPFPAFAECEQAVEAVLIPAGDLNRWMAESAPWRDYVFSLVAKRMANIIGLVEEVVFRRMDRRIAAYLLSRCRDADTETIQATHQEIASDLGTSREVVSRILKDLETGGHISVARGAITIRNQQKLQEKSEEP